MGLGPHRAHCAADYYNAGGCLVGLAPLGQSAWEPLGATFAPPGSVVTVYINQEGATYNTVVHGLTVRQLIGAPVTPSLL